MICLKLHSPLPLLCDSTKLVTPSSGSQAMFPGDVVNTLFSYEGTEVESPRKFPAPPKNSVKTGKRFGVNLTQDGSPLFQHLTMPHLPLFSWLRLHPLCLNKEEHCMNTAHSLTLSLISM